MTVQILTADALGALRDLPAGSVHCVVTSPPYWGCRGYGGEPGMIGLEPTFDEHLESLVAVFREVRRVLRKDGTLWLNYGDAYTSGGRATWRSDASDNKDHRIQDDMPRPATPCDLKPKDLIMMPARVAMALQADWWWLRSEIVWHKPNPMPESVTDRPTSAHEKVFLFAKSRRYFYDATAVRTPPKDASIARLTRARLPDPETPPGSHPHTGIVGARKRSSDKQRGHGRRHDGFNDRWDALSKGEQCASGANLRNVWSVATRPYRGAHFATFPPDLVEPCIKAGTSGRGVCRECGAPWARVVAKSVHGDKATDGASRERTGKDAAGPRQDGNVWNENNGRGFMPVGISTAGWLPSCECNAGKPIPARVLDPFGGAGTVGLVAARLGRDAVLIEINPDYAEMARARIEGAAPLFNLVGDCTD